MLVSIPAHRARRLKELEQEKAKLKRLVRNILFTLCPVGAGTLAIPAYLLPAGNGHIALGSILSDITTSLDFRGTFGAIRYL